MSKIAKYLNPKDAVKGYLDARAKDDALFAEMYKKPNKNLNGCWAYIVGIAKKRGSTVCMTDDEVYGLAVHYYCEDDLKVSPLPKKFESRMSTSNDVTLSEDEKVRLRREAEEEFKSKVMKDLESAEKMGHKRAETEKKKRDRSEAKKMKTAGMGCLFDF